jgi:hypothetical protein
MERSRAAPLRERRSAGAREPCAHTRAKRNVAYYLSRETHWRATRRRTARSRTPTADRDAHADSCEHASVTLLAHTSEARISGLPEGPLNGV